MRKGIGEYTIDWPEIAVRVKEKAGWKCVRCGHPNEFSNGHILTVHHLDLNKSNNSWWNLAALCQRCHLHIQNKVFMDQPWMLEHSDWFRPYVAGFYAHRLGQPEDEIYVLGHLDELILLGRGI